MKVLALLYLDLSVSIGSACLLQRHWGHLRPRREIFHHGPAAQSYSRASATYQENHRTVLEAKENLLVTAMLISPDLGVSSPSCGSCDIPEVRRGSRLRELSLAKSPSADRLLVGWPLVSLSMSKATLSVHGTFGWKKQVIPHYNDGYSTCSKPINWVNHTHAVQLLWLSSQERNTRISKFCPKLLLQSTLKRWRKKQEMGLRFKKGTQICLYHSLCLYGLLPWAMMTCTEFYSILL